MESARTQTHFIVGTAASLATSFAQCLDFALPPCFSVVTSVCHLLMFVMGRLRVEMGQMRRIAKIKVDHGCVREPFSKDHSHVFKVKSKYISHIQLFSFSEIQNSKMQLISIGIKMNNKDRNLYTTIHFNNPTNWPHFIPTFVGFYHLFIRATRRKAPADFLGGHEVKMLSF